MGSLDRAETLLVPVWRDKNVFVAGEAPRALLPTAREGSVLIDRASEIVWLGRADGRDVFAVDVSGEADPLGAAGVGGRAELQDLRMLGGLIPAEEAELLAYARGILHWHQRHRHCGACGQLTRPKEGGHVRECPGCTLKHFPRTDPAVMVLVTRGDSCVLARQPGWPQGMYALVAGFVEPGESIEDAAHREVKEELGVGIGEVAYLRSQPWPFPSSLMIGFSAEAEGDTLTVDHEELEDARWFTRTELENPVGFFFPPAYSLAHQLIRRWLGGSG